MEQSKYEDIIRKITGLLAVAEDNVNEEEAQSAFLVAQKLMIKHNIELSEVQSNEEKVNIQQGQATAHKTLYWFERKLAIIIANNFRVKHYYNNKKRGRIARAITFFGLENDVKLAKEMYILACEVLTFYTKKYIDAYYKEYYQERDKSLTNQLKNSYMQGFLNGLSNKMEEQRFSLQEEFGLVVLTPKVVEDEYEEFSRTFTKPLKLVTPDITEEVAYHRGYKDGNDIDYTKSTIDDDIVD